MLSLSNLSSYSTSPRFVSMVTTWWPWDSWRGTAFIWAAPMAYLGDGSLSLLKTKQNGPLIRMICSALSPPPPKQPHRAASPERLTTAYPSKSGPCVPRNVLISAPRSPPDLFIHVRLRVKSNPEEWRGGWHEEIDEYAILKSKSSLQSSYESETRFCYTMPFVNPFYQYAFPVATQPTTPEKVPMHLPSETHTPHPEETTS